jgi:2-dehydropantoate 2-reductase
MRIAVFGVGGIGGFLGARLAQASDDVALIARGPHLTAIQAHGLFVESPTGDFHITPSIATDRPQDVGVVDAVLLGVKAWGVRPQRLSARWLAPPQGASPCKMAWRRRRRWPRWWGKTMLWSG